MSTCIPGGDRPELEPWCELAQGIVLQAVNDWRTLLAEGSIPGGSEVDLASLREFFRSPWCAQLLSGTSAEPDAILARLEGELAAAAPYRRAALERAAARPRPAVCGEAPELTELRRWGEARKRR